MQQLEEYLRGEGLESAELPATLADGLENNILHPHLQRALQLQKKLHDLKSGILQRIFWTVYRLAFCYWIVSSIW
jgi:hypothetical protein